MTPLTPDHVPCRHCGQPISWDEVCWTHDATGFADCDVQVTGGTPLENFLVTPEGSYRVLVDPEVCFTERPSLAEPVGEWH
jgi:hypothetical protein